MKKTLTFKKTEKNYVIEENGTELISIDFSTKEIKGEDLFTKIYSNAKENEPFEVELNKDGVFGKDDEILYKQLVELFKDIDEEVAKQFALSGKPEESEKVASL